MDGARWHDGSDVVGDAGGAGKDRFTSLDTLALARELRALGRTHLDKSFDGPNGAISIALRSPSAGRRELYLHPGQYAAVLEEGPEHGPEPGPLARELRRLLSGAVITDVLDPGGERILTVLLQRADGPDPLTLAVELFGQGNLVVARGATIAAVAHPKVWAHRAVRVGAEYRPPPGRGNPWARSAAEIESTLSTSRTDRASTLAARLGFGGPIAEELLVRAGLPGDVPAPTDAAGAAPALHRALLAVLEEVGEHPQGYLYQREGTLIDVEPYPSARWRGAEGVEELLRPTFSAAAQEYFSTVPLVVVAPRADPIADRRAELERQRIQQEAAVAALAAEAARWSALADAIYAHFEAAERARAALEAARDEPERGEISLGELMVPIWVRRPLEESARTLYEEAKKAQAKLAGARAALSDTQGRAAEVPEPAPSPSGPSAPVERRRAPHWFEKYRWFLSSEGILVIGGRDAGSNDLIVRRYLKPADLYIHADIHGAPSVVVKHDETGAIPIGNPTLTEAGQFGVAFSKAWRAGLASASAFWVRADQVSKAAASGEFVARGAWVIHGSKNVLRDLPTELAIGTVDYRGESLWSVAPPSALRARGRVLAVVTPGDERRRAEVEVELSQSLELPRSRLQALLPAGGISARRT
jgi:predicted ribosome quality control (RQC) complex YloA/Tae2 family protein